MGTVNIPLGQWSGSDATDRLRETIVDLNGKTDRQTKVLIWLTIVLVILTVAILALTAVLVFDPRQVE